MSALSRQTVLGCLGLAVVGFAVGAAGSAWQTREARAAPWRKLHVEHQGTAGRATRTRAVFENPKLPLQAVELTRSPDGSPELARVALRTGEELTLRYEGRNPASLDGADGAQATLQYHEDKIRVAFLQSDGKTEVGARVLRVPVELQSALHVARADVRPGSALAALWREATGFWIGDAWAQPSEPADVQVKREVEIRLEVRAPDQGSTGRAEIEAQCPPLTCLPTTGDVPMPGQSTVWVTVAGSVPRDKLSKPTDHQALDRFRETASEEREVAQQVLPDIAAAIAAVGLTAVACRALKLSWSICVSDLSKSATASAVYSLTSHDVDRSERVLDQRAEELYYEDQARAALDRDAQIEVCASRRGFARACTQVAARPFAAAESAPVQRSLELRRGIGGTVNGSFVLLQSDGGDCKFSPSPKTSGTLRLTFDNKTNTVTGLLKANERGTRPNLRCSLGTANMSWAQNYSITVTQSFSAEQLRSGGPLSLHLTGTMAGTGNYSFSNCRTSGGASANCPAGKSENYSYPVELTGQFDPTQQTGNGRLVVKAPLPTSGTWRIPAGDSP